MDVVGIKLALNCQLKPVRKHKHQSRKGRLGVYDVKYAIFVDVGKGSPYQHAAFDVTLPRLWVYTTSVIAPMD
jgi:hypothetical protein